MEFSSRQARGDYLDAYLLLMRENFSFKKKKPQIACTVARGRAFL